MQVSQGVGSFRGAEKKLKELGSSVTVEGGLRIQPKGEGEALSVITSVRLTIWEFKVEGEWGNNEIIQEILVLVLREVESQETVNCKEDGVRQTI
jgi:hypothetical protein